MTAVPPSRSIRVFGGAPSLSSSRSISEAIATWNPKAAPSPSWRSGITPESQTRISKGHVDFPDSGGTVHTYSLHGRFTPGPGRIYFRLRPEIPSAEIAYIGWKTGI